MRVDDQTNQTGELTAILELLQAVPPTHPIKIISDSRYCIDGIMWHSRKWEDKGWIGVENKELFQAILSRCRARNATTELEWVKGHSEVEGNERADRLAAEGAQLQRPLSQDLQPIHRFLPSGAKIENISQSTIYRGLKERETYTQRASTQRNVARIQDEIQEASGKRPKVHQIWRAITDKGNSRKIMAFLWKAIHNAYRCGKWWSNIEGY